MPAWFSALNVFLSDRALEAMMLCLGWVTWRSWLARNGPITRAFSELMLGLFVFFGIFAVVYWDRRFDIVPGINLFAVIGYEWYWPPRALVIVVVVRLWLALRGAR